MSKFQNHFSPRKKYIFDPFFSDEKSISLLSIALRFIVISLYTQAPQRNIAQTPLKMLERPTFTMRSSYEDPNAQTLRSSRSGIFFYAKVVKMLQSP